MKSKTVLPGLAKKPAMNLQNLTFEDQQLQRICKNSKERWLTAAEIEYIQLYRLQNPGLVPISGEFPKVRTTGLFLYDVPAYKDKISWDSVNNKRNVQSTNIDIGLPEFNIGIAVKTYSSTRRFVRRTIRKYERFKSVAVIHYFLEEEKPEVAIDVRENEAPEVAMEAIDYERCADDFEAASQQTEVETTLPNSLPVARKTNIHKVDWGAIGRQSVKNAKQKKRLYVVDFKALLLELLTSEAGSVQTEFEKTPLNSWSVAKQVLKDDIRYRNVRREDRKYLWRQFAEDVKQKQERCVDDFKSLLLEVLPSEVACLHLWSTAKKVLETDVRYSKVPEQERKPLWRQFAEHMKKERYVDDFKTLLLEVLPSMHSWSVAKQALETDIRYKKVPKKERKIIWRQFVKDTVDRERQAFGGRKWGNEMLYEWKERKEREAILKGRYP